MAENEAEMTANTPFIRRNRRHSVWKTPLIAITIEGNDQSTAASLLLCKPHSVAGATSNRG